MSLNNEDEMYRQKYLMYKKKYYKLKELEQNGSGVLSTLKSAAKSGASYASAAAAHPAAQAAVSMALTDPRVQQRLANISSNPKLQSLASSPLGQAALLQASQSSTVQSALAHPLAQTAKAVAGQSIAPAVDTIRSAVAAPSAAAPSAAAAIPAQLTVEYILNNISVDQKKELLKQLMQSLL